jgi:putative flippase GtrA
MAGNTFLRFALVGCINYLVSFVVFVICYRYLPLDDLSAALGRIPGTNSTAIIPLGAASNVIAYLTGMVNSFVLNKYWTFRSKGNTTEQAIKFIVVNLVTLGLSTFSVYVLVDRLAYPQYPVWLTVTGTLLALNYAGSRYWAFAGPSPGIGRRKLVSPP